VGRGPGDARPLLSGSIDALIDRFDDLDASPSWRTLGARGGAAWAIHPPVGVDGGSPYVRATTTLGASPAAVSRCVIDHLLDTHQRWSRAFTGGAVIGARSPVDRDLVLRYSMPWPLAPRACLFRQLAVERSAARYEVCVDLNRDAPPGYVRLSLDFAVKRIAPAADGGAIYTAISQTRMGGWLERAMPATLMARIVARDAGDELRQLARFVETSADADLTPHAHI